MYSRVSIVIVLCVFIFTGCSFFPGEIKTAERLIETAPDSALQILRNVTYDKSLSAAERANYGLLLFEALDKTYQPLKPDSVLNFSIDYYKRKRNSEKLAKGYFYKGRLYNYAYQYENATKLYILALDNLKGSNDYDLLAKVYSDLGHISVIQNEFTDARGKFEKAVDYFLKAGKADKVYSEKINIGNTYRYERDFSKAYEIYKDVLRSSSDSMIYAVALQEIGINFYRQNEFDSSIYYLKKCIEYPYQAFYQSIKLFRLADSYYELDEYDSAFHYANLSLSYPANFHTKRECFRILANTSYLKGNYKEMAGYMTYYQNYTDSVRIIDSQTKSIIIENIHEKSENANKTKFWLWLSLSLLPFFLLTGLLLYIKLRKKNKGAEVELEQKSEKIVEYEQKLYSNHEHLKNNLLFKIEEVRKREKAKSKRLTLHEKLELDRKIFEECLYIDDTPAFERLMNFTFNNIVTKLKKLNHELSKNELMYCCLLLLDLSSQEITLILNVQLSSLYKLKQRLAQKLNLNSSMDVVSYIKTLWIK